MKTRLICLIALLTLQTIVVQSQTIETPPRPSFGPVFVRIYPLELIMHEVRMGVELPTAPRQAIVLDGSYFWGDNATNDLLLRKGWALKMDYRFYMAEPSAHVRFFVGPNLMIKGQQYTTETYNYGSSGSTLSTDSRMVYCGNVKVGIDIQLAKAAHTRLELFSGAGIRYQSSSQNLSLGWGDSSSGSSTNSRGRFLPNMLLGILLKL